MCLNSRLPSLCNLEIGKCKDVLWRSTASLSPLNSLVLENNTNKLFLEELLMKEVFKLGELIIDDCL